MPQSLRPTRLKLRQVTREPNSPYARDCGYYHVLDYYLHHASRDLIRLACRCVSPRIGRDLDAEEETDGRYR